MRMRFRQTGAGYPDKLGVAPERRQIFRSVVR
jgi:hypothetical protein